MDERGIIIADRDAEFRRQVAEYFRKAGYEVETTDSTVHVLCSILQKQTPVLLLGSDFDKKVSSCDLIHLLKKCNRHLSVIMVSDDLPIAQAREVRKAGIFYQTTKPGVSGDAAELGLAVECAFSKFHAARQRDRLEAAMRRRENRRQEADRKMRPEPRGQRLSWLVTLAALVFVTSILAISAAEGVLQGSNTGVWLFLGFCALLIATQLLPVFRIKLPHRLSRRGSVKEEVSAIDEDAR